MPVPSNITDLSTTAGSNSPAGSETPAEGDNYIRSLSSFIAVLRDKLNGTSDTGTVKNATFSGTMAGAASWAALQTFAAGISVSTGGNVYSGTYTPTVTGLANVDSCSGQVCQYMRVGNVVTVSGALSIDATSVGVETRVSISLPIASDIGFFYQLAGTGAASVETTAQAAIYGLTSDAASFDFTPSTPPTGLTWMFTFTYRVI